MPGQKGSHKPTKKAAQTGAPRVPKKRVPQCRICTSAKRSAIDLDMVHGVPNREVARRHGVSEQAVRRHSEHIREWLIYAAAKAEELGYREGMDLIEHWEQMYKSLLRSHARARGPSEKQRWVYLIMQWVDRGRRWEVIQQASQRLLDSGDTLSPALQEHLERVIRLNRDRTVRLIKGGVS